MYEAKLTKREYNRQKSLISGSLARVSARVELLENKDMSHLELAEWSRLCDEQYEMQQELRSLEARWSTRDWTGADWALRGLVALNID